MDDLVDVAPGKDGMIAANALVKAKCVQQTAHVTQRNVCIALPNSTDCSVFSVLVTLRACVLEPVSPAAGSARWFRRRAQSHARPLERTLSSSGFNIRRLFSP
jgi:hypothetical protein